MTPLKHRRPYRFLRAFFTIAAAIVRYLTLRIRNRIPLLRPSAAAWERAHQRTGRAIYRLATSLGGAFVKLGQVLGARTDVLPQPFLRELRGLHDRVPARPFAELEGHVERELGRPIAEVFADLEREPLAAASLAQVHRARLAGSAGAEVAVKIQYPEARRLFPGDLASLRLAARATRLVSRGLDLRPLVGELAEFVTLELNFAREADSTEQIGVAFAKDARVRVPRVYRELSTDRLLVLGFLEGTPVTRLEELRARGVELREVAAQVAAVYGAMIFEHGFFHGDPHPGNLLWRDDGSLGLLDFGLAKELPPDFSRGIATLIARVFAGDVEGAREAALGAGFEVDGDPKELIGMIRMLLGESGSPRRLLSLFAAGSVRKIPTHFALIVRVFVLLNGLSHSLAPGERLIQQAMIRALAPHLAGSTAA